MASNDVNQVTDLEDTEVEEEERIPRKTILCAVYLQNNKEKQDAKSMFRHNSDNQFFDACVNKLCKRWYQLKVVDGNKSACNELVGCFVDQMKTVATCLKVERVPLPAQGMTSIDKASYNKWVADNNFINLTRHETINWIKQKFKDKKRRAVERQREGKELFPAFTYDDHVSEFCSRVLSASKATESAATTFNADVVPSASLLSTPVRRLDRNGFATPNIEQRIPSSPYTTSRPPSAPSRGTNPFPPVVLGNAGPLVEFAFTPDSILQHRFMTRARLDTIVERYEKNHPVIQELASRKEDKSTSAINGKCSEVFLMEDSKEHGYANSYVKLFQNNHRGQGKKGNQGDPNELYVPPEEIKTFIEEMVTPELDAIHMPKYKVKVLSFLSADDPDRGPQVIHFDNRFRDTKDAELFGIFLMSPNSPGTDYCDVSDYPASPSIEYMKGYFIDQGYEPGLVERVLRQIENCPKAKSLFEGYGSLLFATPETLVESGTRPQYSGYVFKDSHPHRAPSFDKFRLVIFFTLVRDDSEAAHTDDTYSPSKRYSRSPTKSEGKVDSNSEDEPNGDAENYFDGFDQISRVKLLWLIYESILEHTAANPDDFKIDERKFFIEIVQKLYLEQAAMGAYDSTFTIPRDFPDGFEKLLETYNEPGNVGAAKVSWKEGGDQLKSIRKEIERHIDAIKKLEANFDVTKVEVEELERIYRRLDEAFTNKLRVEASEIMCRDYKSPPT